MMKKAQVMKYETSKEEDVENIVEDLTEGLFNETWSLVQQTIFKMSGYPWVPVGNIRSTTDGINEYISELFEVIDSDILLRNLNIPLHRDPLELLANLQNTEIGGFIDPLDYISPHQKNVLDVDWYLQLERERDQS